MDEGDRFPVPPPKHSVERVAAYPNAFLHLASPVTGLAETADGVRVETPNAVIETNAVILATGFGLDLALRPELAHFAAHIRTWGDVVGPEKAAANPALAGHPYLADDFAFTEKTPGACPALSKLFCFAYAAVPTHGKVTSGIPAASDGADRLAKGLVRSFFAEDADFHLARFCDYSIRDFDAGTWEATAMEIMA